MKLSEIIAAYMDVLPTGIVLEEKQVERSLKKAVRFYCGYARLSETPTTEVHTPINAENETDGDQDFELTPSEYAVVRPLFELYVEMENSASLEASRAMGLDAYGRGVSEVSQDIRTYETDMPRQAFLQGIETV